MALHAKFSASSSNRWQNCPGSIALIEKAPPEGESPYAVEGTLAHSVLEIFLTSKKPYTESFKLKGKYPKEMVEYAFQAFKEIESRKVEGAILLSETKCDLSFLHPKTFGTTDAAIVEEFGTLVVIDYKYGAGHRVSPVENSQLIFYALGLAHKYDYNFRDVELVIIQPRTGEQESIKSWKMPIEDLHKWAQKFKDAIQEALKPNAPLAAGEWCKFCPAATICPEISKKAMQTAQIEFDVIEDRFEAPSIQDLSGEILGQTLNAVGKIETWIKALRSHAFQVLQRGEPVPGFKLVPKRATRKWIDVEAAMEAAEEEFGDDAFKRELWTPAQFEKKVNKEFVKTWAQAISSGVTLAHESDARSASDQIGSDFDEIIDL